MEFWTVLGCSIIYGIICLVGGISIGNAILKFFNKWYSLYKQNQNLEEQNRILDERIEIFEERNRILNERIEIFERRNRILNERIEIFEERNRILNERIEIFERRNRILKERSISVRKIN